MSIKKYKLVSKINNEGWPVHTRSGQKSEKWKKAHTEANKFVRQKHGDQVANDVNKIARQTPEGQLIGTHSRQGKIKVAEVVPRSLREAVHDHEDWEHARMVGDESRLKYLRHSIKKKL